jgi:hypothetical protein
MTQGKSALLQPKVHSQYHQRASHIHSLVRSKIINSLDFSITCKRIQARQMQHENSKQALQKICIRYNGKMSRHVFTSFQISAVELLLKTLSVSWLHSNGTRGLSPFCQKKSLECKRFDLRALFKHIKGDSCDTIVNRRNISGNFSS